MNAEHQAPADHAAADDGATAPQPPPGTWSGPDGPRAALGAVRAEVAKAVVGQDAVVTGLLIALLCQGHVLLEGVPGVAKTLLIRTLAASLRLETKRIQFTPDLMPGDVTGSLVYDARTRRVRVPRGPGLHQPAAGRRDQPDAAEDAGRAARGAWRSARSRWRARPRPLPEPFLVAATQNPVEYEGTYPLPEAQLDRFLLKLTVPLPGRDEEIGIVARHAARLRPAGPGRRRASRPAAGAADLAAALPRSGRCTSSPELTGYIVDLCRATRQSPSLLLGVSPRGATALLATSRAWAWLSGRDYVTPDDVKALARPTFRHRVQLRPEAELEGTTAGRDPGGRARLRPRPPMRPIQS